MDFNQMMKKMQEMQKQFTEIQNQQENKEFEGCAVGGQVSITIVCIKMGSYKVKKVKIDPSLLVAEEADILEDLLIAAFNDALKKATEDNEGALSGLMPPGFKLPF